MSISKPRPNTLMIRKDLVADSGVIQRLIQETEDYIVIYQPGRTVYIDSVNGSQYVPSAYIVYKKQRELEQYYYVIEILRFSRAI